MSNWWRLEVGVVSVAASSEARHCGVREWEVSENKPTRFPCCVQTTKWWVWRIWVRDEWRNSAILPERGPLILIIFGVWTKLQTRFGFVSVSRIGRNNSELGESSEFRMSCWWRLSKVLCQTQSQYLFWLESLTGEIVGMKLQRFFEQKDKFEPIRRCKCCCDRFFAQIERWTENRVHPLTVQ